MRDWSAYRRERLQKVLDAIRPEILMTEALIFEEIEIAEVNELFQRFRDFQSEVDQIRAKYNLH